MIGCPSVISVVPVETQVLVRNMYSAYSIIAAAEEDKRFHTAEHVFAVDAHPAHHGNIALSIHIAAYLR